MDSPAVSLPVMPKQNLFNIPGYENSPLVLNSQTGGQPDSSVAESFSTASSGRSV